jgi:hypothetical protein
MFVSLIKYITSFSYQRYVLFNSYYCNYLSQMLISYNTCNTAHYYLHVWLEEESSSAVTRVLVVYLREFIVPS